MKHYYTTYVIFAIIFSLIFTFNFVSFILMMIDYDTPEKNSYTVTMAKMSISFSCALAVLLVIYSGYNANNYKYYHTDEILENLRNLKNLKNLNL